MRTGIGATGEVCNNLEPCDLLLSEEEEVEADVGCLQGQVSVLNMVNELFKIPKLTLTVKVEHFKLSSIFWKNIPYVCPTHYL